MTKHTLTPISERFWPKVVRDPETECWEWTASKDPSGYGHIGRGGRGNLIGAHRVSYELNVGPIPDGLTIDHLCRNRGCVNPAHLEPVTMRENILRGVSPQARNAAKTRCKNGHPFTPANTILAWRNGRPWRRCRACHLRQGREWYARKRQAA